MDLREAAQGASRHPWEVARFRFFSRVLEGASAFSSPLRVLDIGSGDAWFAEQLGEKLAPGSSITCWDTGYARDVERRSERLTLVRERPEGKMGLLLLLDVLEHVEQDVPFLRSLVEAHTSSGTPVLVSVPAWQRLFTSHDTYLHHYRRYSPREGRALVEAAGLRIELEGGLFHSLLFPRAVSKVVETGMTRMLGREPHSQAAAWNGGRLLTGAVGAALAADNALSHALARRHVMAPGLSWWALCRAS